MAQRDNRDSVWVLGMYLPAAGATRRCPVQPSTPLGPGQVNVLLLLVSAEDPDFNETFIGTVLNSASCG
jgi:hypothetical protein